MATLLPFAVGDAVAIKGYAAKVVEVKGGRVVAQTLHDDMVHITTDEKLRAQQPGFQKVAS